MLATTKLTSFPKPYQFFSCELERTDGRTNFWAIPLKADESLFYYQSASVNQHNGSCISNFALNGFFFLNLYLGLQSSFSFLKNLVNNKTSSLIRVSDVCFRVSFLDFQIALESILKYNEFKVLAVIVLICFPQYYSHGRFSR